MNRAKSVSISSRRDFLAGLTAASLSLATSPLYGLTAVGPQDTPQTSKLRWIGYTAGRNDLPSGQFDNWRTQRARIVLADGSNDSPTGESLIENENGWTQFAGWSNDGAKAIVLSLWEDPANAAWEREQRTFRMTEGWLVDCCLVELETGAIQNLTEIERVSIYNTGLFYLPDGSGFGFTPLINGVSVPFVMDPDGRNKRDVSGSTGGFAYGFSASPDGELITYHENYQLVISSVDGSHKQTIDTGHPFNFAPSWSPDGKYILFVSGEHYDCHPHIIERDGSGLRKIADRGGYRGVVERLKHPDFHSESSDLPVWSRDGQSIFFTAQVKDRVELMRASLDGRVTQLSDSASGVRHYHPSPSPDGTQILFGSDRSGTMQLHVSDLDGNNAIQVTNVPPDSCAMHGHWQRWPDDGT